jgi:hypothetical protein
VTKRYEASGRVFAERRSTPVPGSGRVSRNTIGEELRDFALASRSNQRIIGLLIREGRSHLGLL